MIKIGFSTVCRASFGTRKPFSIQRQGVVIVPIAAAKAILGQYRGRTRKPFSERSLNRSPSGNPSSNPGPVVRLNSSRQPITEFLAAFCRRQDDRQYPAES